MSPGDEELASAHRRLEALAANVCRVLLGKEEPVRQAIVALASAGHLLLEDVPGVGKTLLARSLARSIRASYCRIQCTPDLLPADVTGTSVYDPREMVFQFRPGPVFHQVVLVDEINRATPRTQAALLEAMEERQVTLDGETRPLPDPFLVLATQNPVEMEGTFPLPEAQLDRFLLRVKIGYPDAGTEVRMLEAQQEEKPGVRLEPVFDVKDLSEIQAAVRRVPVSRPIREYVTSIVDATRRSEELELGASPRASLALQRAAQARALFRPDDWFVTPQDVKEMALPVLGHRLLLGMRSRLAGATGETVIERILRGTVVPVVPGPPGAP
ncbi:MAG: AAA family ATPase [Planctomycetes bacterium]|nr:AAA family ATPase [Planctomycetota bacterium]